MKTHLIGTLCLLTFSSTILNAEDWTQWRGNNRDAKSSETGLLQSWPEDGPRVIWKIDNAGVGYSSVSVAGGKIFTMGDLEGVEHILAFDEKTGKRLWAVQPEPVKASLDASVAEKFQQMDSNKDGKVDEFEVLKKGNYQIVKFDAQDINADLKDLANARANRFLEHYDKDESQNLEVNEIPAGLGRDIRNIDRPSGGRREFTAIAEKRATAEIKVLDADGNGTLERKEYQNAILRNNANKIDVPASSDTKRGDGVITSEELSSYYAKQEKGFDGILSKEELQNYFASNHPGRDGFLTAEDIKGSMGGYRNGQGDGPRGTPTVIGNRLYTEGGNGDVTCLDTETGNTIWHTNLVSDFGGKRPGWGYSESALVVNDLVFVTPGSSEGTMVALNTTTGKPVWKSASVNQGAHYASPVLAVIGGQKQIVQFGRKSMFGVTFDDGNLLWTYENAANGTANCSTAIIDGEHVLASSAYGTGGGLAAISSSGESQKSAEVWFEKKLANHHGGLVKVGDHVYGFGNGGLICIHFLSGEIKWVEPSVRKGSLIFADKQLYCLGEGHQVALVTATPEKYIENGRFSIESQGRPSWAHPVVANGVFYIRDQGSLTAYDVKAK